MKKYFIGLVIMSVVLFTGCGSEKKAPKKKVILSIFQFKVEIANQFNDLAQKYMKLHPEAVINIETVGGGGDYGAALRAKMASGNEPTIFNVGGPQDIVDWLDKLEDLSNMPLVSKAFPNDIAGATLNKKVYGLPFAEEGYGFIYNKEIFKKAGIDASKIVSFQTLKAAVIKLNDQKAKLGLEAVFALPGKETWVTGLHFSNIALAQEFGNVFNAYHAKNVEFKYSAGMKKLFDLQVKYGKKPVNAIDYSTQVERLFSMKKVAIILQGTWAYDSIAGVDKELATNNIGFLPTPIPGAKEDIIPVGIPMYWVINKNATVAQKKLAKDFLTWVYTSKTGKDYVVNKFNFIPPYKGFEAHNLQPKTILNKTVLQYSTSGKTVPWVFMGYPSGWGMDKLGVLFQIYIEKKITWDQLIKKAQKDWADSRSNNS